MNNTFAFNDPLIGETHISAEKLNAVWQANGGCGLVVLPEPDPLIPESAAPLFGGAAALATLAALGALGANRKGIGGYLPDVEDDWRTWRQSLSSQPAASSQAVPDAGVKDTPPDAPPHSGSETTTSSPTHDSGSSGYGARANRFDWEAWLEQEKARFAVALNEAKGQAKTEAESAFARYQKMKDETWASREDEAMPVDYWEIVERLQDEKEKEDRLKQLEYDLGAREQDVESRKPLQIPVNLVEYKTISFSPQPNLAKVNDLIKQYQGVERELNGSGFHDDYVLPARWKQELSQKLIREVGLNQADINALAVTGFAETRQVGSPATALVMLTALNRMRIDGKTLEQVLVPGSYDALRDVVKYFPANTTYDSAAKYLQAINNNLKHPDRNSAANTAVWDDTQELAWQLLVGNKIGDPTALLDYEGSRWNQPVSVQDPESLASKIKRGYDANIFYEVNVHVSRLEQAKNDFVTYGGVSKDRIVSVESDSPRGFIAVPKNDIATSINADYQVPKGYVVLFYDNGTKMCAVPYTGADKLQPNDIKASQSWVSTNDGAKWQLENGDKRGRRYSVKMPDGKIITADSPECLKGDAFKAIANKP